MRPPSPIVILTGAGISAESGVSTFRDKDGIWSKIDYRDVATPEGFARNPARVHEFYNMRRQAVRQVEPNAAHFALARLEQEYPGDVLVITQNVDSLHEAAGTKNLIHMHGQHNQVVCSNCGHRMPWAEDLSVDAKCPHCHMLGMLRPDVVWFGEMPYHMDRIQKALVTCELFISIGTSGTVYPAAGFVMLAADTGAHTVELNLEPSDGVSRFEDARHGPATELVPAYVDELLAEAGAEDGRAGG